MPSQVKEYDGKLTDLEDRICSEIAPLKKALDNHGNLTTEVSKLTARVDGLYARKENAAANIQSLKDCDDQYEKMLDALPGWKVQIEQRLTSHQAKFEDFLTQHWRPHRKKFDNMLDEWQAAKTGEGAFRKRSVRVVENVDHLRWKGGNINVNRSYYIHSKVYGPGSAWSHPPSPHPTQPNPPIPPPPGCFATGLARTQWALQHNFGQCEQLGGM